MVVTLKVLLVRPVQTMGTLGSVTPPPALTVSVDTELVAGLDKHGRCVLVTSAVADSPSDSRDERDHNTYLLYGTMEPC